MYKFNMTSNLAQNTSACYLQTIVYFIFKSLLNFPSTGKAYIYRPKLLRWIKIGHNNSDEFIPILRQIHRKTATNFNFDLKWWGKSSLVSSQKITTTYLVAVFAAQIISSLFFFCVDSVLSKLMFLATKRHNSKTFVPSRFATKLSQFLHQFFSVSKSLS